LPYTKKRGIDEEIKTLIKELFDYGVASATAIIYALRDKKIELDRIPDKKQIYNFLYEYKKEKFGSATITYGELKNWCQTNIYNQYMSNHDAFVLEYNVSIRGKLSCININ
jgi:hypothetical protein